MDAQSGVLAGKVAFVTGAARGQGRSHAVRLAELGAEIVALDICDQIESVPYPMATSAELEETASTIKDLGRGVVADRVDVRDREAVQSAAKQAVAEFGRIDFVLANAGIMPIMGSHANDLSAWHDCVDVMLTGTMHTLEATLPHILEHGEGGSIVITSSMAGIVPTMRTFGNKTLGMLGYGAAKAGEISLMLNYASVLAPKGIRVNTVHPTGVLSPMIMNEAFASWDIDPEDGLAMSNAMPVQAIDIADVTALVAWLCLPESRYITGQTLRVDAGAFLR